MFKEIVKKNRSYRRFFQDHKITHETLVELVELARFSPSARNLQPLKYFLSCTDEMNEKIFSTLAWAGYIKDWNGPEEGEKPSAYIIILNDTSIAKQVVWDDGIMAQSIMLGAVDKGLGGCMIGSVKREELKKLLNIDPKFEIRLVLALGKPKENVVIDDAKSDDDYYYWRDDKKTHHVPKRLLKDLIINM